MCLKQFRQIHCETSELKSLFNKIAGLMVYNFIRKKEVVSCKFSEVFEKTYFIEHIRADA